MSPLIADDEVIWVCQVLLNSCGRRRKDCYSKFNWKKYRDMATIEEIEDLSVEIINELIGDGDEPVVPKAEEAAPVGVPTSPARAAADDAAALAIPGSRNIAEESDDEDDDVFFQNFTFSCVLSL